jgi:hypothetical protein
MKSIYKFLFIAFVITFAAIHFSCDSFDSFPLNIPVSVNVSVSGSGTSISASQTFCLSDISQTFSDYQDKIKTVTFLKAQYRTTSVSSSSLQGTIVITLRDTDGNVLVSISIPGVKPSDFINNPYELQLSQNEIQAINTYLNNLGSECFEATLGVDNISGGSAPYQVVGTVDFVFEADTSF